MTVVDRLRGRTTAIYALLAVLVAGGVYTARGLPAAIFPSVTFPIVKVIADVGEEPAARMMPTVTRPLEEALLRVPGIRSVRSTTSRGSSELTAEFEWGTDMREALQRAQAETQRILPGLPPATRLDVEWMNPASFPIQGYALTSNTRSQAFLLQLAEFTLKPALVRIPGVSQVQIQGGRRREFQVWLDPRALAGRGLSVADVTAAIRKSHLVRSAGLTEENHELYLTLVDGRVHDVAALSDLAVPLPAGPPATLGDLGEVKVADEVSYIRTTADGQPAVLVNIIRQPSANTVAIANDIRQLFRDEPSLLPRDVRWAPFYDQARFVADSVRGTRDAVLIGIVLAGLVLWAFLGELRLTLIAGLTIPITVAVVALALGAAGQTINLMTLAGIAAAIGLVADDAIVVVENIDRIHAEGRSADPAGDGLQEMLPALIGSSLSTTVILLPFALLAGVAGAFFKPLALTMALALVVSFLVAVTAVFVSVSRFGFRGRAAGRAAARARPPRAGGRWLRAATARLTGAGRALAAPAGRAYDRVTGFVIAHGAVAVLVTAGLAAATLTLYLRIGSDFLPHMDEGSIILDYWTPPGTSLTDTDEMLRQVERIIQATPDVAGYSRRTGTQLGFFITEPNRGDYVVNLKPRGTRRPVETVMDDLRARIEAVEPAVHTDFGQLLEDNIGDLTGGAPQPIDIKLFGDDPAVLQAKARQAARIVAGVRGVEDVFDGIVIAGPALDIRVDPRAAARYGLTTEDVHAAVEPAVTGTVVDQVRVSDRMYDLRVFTRHDGPLGDLRIRAPAPGSALLPLSTVARIETGPPEAEIDRENLKTFVGVTARLSGRDLGGAIAEIRNRLGRELPLPSDMSIRYGGLYQQQQQSFRGLFLVLLAGLVLVSVVVLVEFGDWRAPIVTSLCAVAGLAGVLLALTLTGMTLNISSYVGAIMMVGIVGENAIFVIHEARSELARGLAPPEAWLRASRRRLRPVAMTVLATAFALAPLALALGEGSQLMQPLAVAVIGGFVLSGPIVLVVLPGLYHLLDPRGRLAAERSAPLR